MIADDSRWGQIPSGKKMPLDKAPILIEDTIQNIDNDLTPVKNEPLHFTFHNVKMINPEKLVLQPFYQIYDARYMMYWLALTNKGYKSYLDSIAKDEKERLELDKRTVDYRRPRRTTTGRRSSNAKQQITFRQCQ